MLEKQATNKKTESKGGSGFLKIPFDFFTLTISNENGGIRFLTSSEIRTIAFIMQYPKEKFSARTLSRRLCISSTSVVRAIKKLTQAGLIKVGH